MSLFEDFSFEGLWKKFTDDRTQSLPPPDWEPWDFDYAFFEELGRWNDEHPQNPFDKIFNKINTGVRRVEPLFELIPDSPFPARGLVKALAHLVTLGATVARAKSDVQDFALQTVNWVTEMTEALKAGTVKRGSFNWKTKKNLEKRCILVRAICTWAAERLHDNRWEQMTNGLSISREIREFRTQVAEARALFMDLSVIALSQGIDKLFKEQRKISQEIKEVRRIQLNQLGEILETLENQRQAEERRRFMDQMLQSQVVANPTYNEQGKQPCDPDTRVDVLAEIHTWIKDVTPNAKSFLWLTGDPGSGKSAITASIARDCKDAGILWAQFFINRNNVDTTNPEYHFPSIARQLANHYPESEVSLAIHDALKKKQSLVDNISAEQAMRLFADAVEVAAKMDPKTPVLVVIDGLDESERSRLDTTAEIFSSLFKAIQCPNVKVLISSRTDDEIRRSFAQANHLDYVKHVHLDTAAESSIRDVSLFLMRRIGEIVEKNDLNWELWPGKERMQALCNRASGLFIWAVTSIKFFQEQLKVSGTEGLNKILDLLSSDGLGDINVLYSTILNITYLTSDDGKRSAELKKMDEWKLETFRRIVGCVVVLQEPLSIGVIRDMLDLRQTKNDDPVDFVNFFRRLRTVLVAGADIVDDNTIPRLHKSFFEFITSESAEERFRVHAGLSNGEIATQCLRRISTFHQSSTHPSPLSFPTAALYALRFWQSHLPQHERTLSGVAVVPGSLSLHEIREQLRTSLEDRGSGKPLGVAFLPNRSRILTSWDDSIQVWDGLSGQPIRLPPFEAHTNVVHSVAFSPDGNHVASGSDGGTVRFWDSESGRAVGSAFEEDTWTVYSVAFSPDGTCIASGSDDTIRLWDLQSGKPIRSAFKGHTDAVLSVAFSPDGTRVVSGSGDCTVRLWDVQSGKQIGSAFEGHTGYVWSVAFSPDGTQVVSGSYDKTIRVWNVETGKSIGTPLNGHADWVRSVAFSPDGSRIVSGSDDKTIQIWDSQNGRAIGSPFKGHTNFVISVAFSPDGTRVVSGSLDNTIRVWDVQSGKDIGLPFEGHIEKVTSVAFSPDGMRIVSGSLDKTVRMWDAQTGQPAQLKFRVQTGHVSAISAFKTTQRIAVASSDGTVQVWDLQNHKKLGAPLIGDLAVISSIAVSSDDKLIAAVDFDGKICLWDTGTQKLLSHTETPCVGPTSLSFSSNSTRIILSHVDGSVFRWNISNRRLNPLNNPSSLSSDLLPQTDKAMSFDMKNGWQRGNAQPVTPPSLCWFPFDDPDAGLWAYIDEKLIRRDGEDSATIYDISTDSGSKGRVAPVG